MPPENRKKETEQHSFKDTANRIYFELTLELSQRNICPRLAVNSHVFFEAKLQK